MQFISSLSLTVAEKETVPATEVREKPKDVPAEFIDVRPEKPEVRPPSEPVVVIEGPETVAKPAVEELSPLHKASGIHRLAVTRDGQGLATLHEDGHIRLWDLADGAERLGWQTGLTSKLPAVMQLAFSPDGQLMVLKRDNVLEVWETASGDRVQEITLKIKEFDTDYVNFIFDGTAIVTAYDDKVALVDPRTGKIRHWGYGRPVLFMACSPTEPLAVLSPLMAEQLEKAEMAQRLPKPPSLGVMNLTNGQLRPEVLREMEKIPASPGSLAFSSDGNWLAVSTLAGPLVLLDASSFQWRVRQKLRPAVAGDFYVYKKLVFSRESPGSDSKLIGIPLYRTPSGSHGVDAWDPAAQHMFALTTGDEAEPRDMVATSERGIAVAHADGSLRFYHPSATGGF